jgi:hypothetical protein
VSAELVLAGLAFCQERAHIGLTGLIVKGGPEIMNTPNIDMADLADQREILQGDIEGTAHWRSEKAAEFPDDRRNLAAVRFLEAMAATVPDIPSHLMRKYLAAFKDPNAAEVQSEMLRAVGFNSAYKSATDFVETFLSLAEPEPDSGGARRQVVDVGAGRADRN